MEELHHYFCTYKPTTQHKPDWDIEVTEIWWDDTLEQTLIEISGLVAQDIPRWLATRQSKRQDDDGTTLYCLARLVLAEKGPSRSWQANPAALQIVNHFGLRLAYGYARSCVTGVTALPPRSGTDVYMVSHPKLVTLWSVQRSPRDAPLQAIFFAGPCERGGLSSLLSRPWDLSLTCHPVFPAFLSGLAISQEVDKTQGGINAVMRCVEARTGHHNSVSRQDEPAQGSWGHLSAKMSGFARKLASTSRKIQIATDLQHFMLAHADEEPSRGGGERAAMLVRHHVGLMVHRLETQRRQNDFLSQKVNIQLTAIFNLMARKDSSIGFQSAASMKTLALVALVFLPGNFLAALFSAPLFDWADTGSFGVGLKPQFGLFWAITIPLVLLVFVMYFGWSLYEKRRFDRVLEEEHS